MIDRVERVRDLVDEGLILRPDCQASAVADLRVDPGQQAEVLGEMRPVLNVRGDVEHVAGRHARIEVLLASVNYADGFGILGAPTQIAYRLDKHCSIFTAYVGVDDNGSIPGAVRFHVWGDRTKLYETGIMQQGALAKFLSVDVSHVSLLRLIVIGQTGGEIENQTGRSGGQSAFDSADWALPLLYCLRG